MRRVVALGGGHGTAVTLRAARLFAEELTAVVSVADDGGSSGRLREQLDVVAVGDLRKCLVALAADGSVLAKAFEHRFVAGDLAGHALGNLVLAGLVEAADGLVAGVDAAAALLGAVGRVLPATTQKVVLTAVGDRGEVNGQVAVSMAGRIERVSLVPEGCSPPPDAVAAIERADQVVIGPGSLYTSVLAAAAVPGIAQAIAASGAQRVYVCNLRPQEPETAGYGVADHVAALARHGVRVDAVLYDPGAAVPPGVGAGAGGRGGGSVEAAAAGGGASSAGAAAGGDARGGASRAGAAAGGGEGGPLLVGADLRSPNAMVHDPVKLAKALSDLLASRSQGSRRARIEAR